MSASGRIQLHDSVAEQPVHFLCILEARRFIRLNRFEPGSAASEKADGSWEVGLGGEWRRMTTMSVARTGPFRGGY